MTAAELVVLGLVVEHPQHGYDLERTIEQRGIREWTDIGFSSIYYLLGKLERSGLVEAGSPAGSSKARRVYRATTDGVRAAGDEALRLVRELRPPALPILVGLANLSLLDPDDYAEALQVRLADLSARIEGVRAAEQAQTPLPLPAREIFSYSLCLLEAERSWLASRVQVHHDQDRPQEDAGRLPGEAW